MLAHFSLVLTLVSLASAAVTPRFKKEQMLFVDYSPAIVSPSGGESWAAGSVQSVSWYVLLAFCPRLNPSTPCPRFALCSRNVLTLCNRNQTALSGNNTPEAQTASIWLGYKSTNASDTNEHLCTSLPALDATD